MEKREYKDRSEEDDRGGGAVVVWRNVTQNVFYSRRRDEEG